TFDAIRRDGEIVGIQAIYRDISARKRAEAERERLREKLLEDRRLESLGVLAGGIAHDFNNLLMGILGNCSIADSDVAPGSVAHESIEEIRVAAKRAAELSRQMLAYSGRGRIVVKTMRLNQLVRDMTDMLEMTAGRKAAIQYDLSPDTPWIEGDPSQLRQMVLDLVENASEALGEDGGEIVVATGRVEVTPRDVAEVFHVGEVEAGACAFIEVRDSGHGIREDLIDRVFDPFFTTRFIGRGLGLAAVSGIVRGHKGAVFVSSTPGGGCTFRVLFRCHGTEGAAASDAPRSHGD
ncbi:MAG: hypothetical protein GY851_08240, partial [bacterium]|nr:hypothetical protein [bacterium]